MATSAPNANLESAITSSLVYLDSHSARQSFAADPYWPKWNSPWWHMTLLWELDAASRIPHEWLEQLLQALKSRYLHFFPFTEKELPPGADPISSVMCHCGLGTAYQILLAAGVDADRELPWIRKWFLQYQIADGGWNCDEAAYLKTEPKSSVVSTVPILEAMLAIPNRRAEETAALDEGVEYLLRRRLVRSLQTQEVIDQDWLRLTFPRFYEYDVLRGLAVVANWVAQRGKTLPREAIEEAVSITQSKLIEKNGKSGLPVERQFHKSCQTRIKDAAGNWTKTPSSEFPLLVWSSQVGEIHPTLTRIWAHSKAQLDRL